MVQKYANIKQHKRFGHSPSSRDCSFENNGNKARGNSPSIFLAINPGPVDHAELCAPAFSLSLKRGRWSQFFCISDKSNSLSDCSKNFKKIYRVEMLFVLKALQPGVSIKVCRKINMPFVAFSGLLEIYWKHCFTEFVSNYHDQEAIKTSK